MNDQHTAKADAPQYEPPTITVLGTLRELTEGHAVSTNSDVINAGSMISVP